MYGHRYFSRYFYAPRYWAGGGVGGGGEGGGEESPLEAIGPPDYQQPRFFIRSAWWPHEVIAELVSAQGNYAWEEMEPGAAQFTVESSEAVLTEDVLQAGNFVSIEHPLFPPFAGVLMTAEDSDRGGQLTLSVLEHYGLLDARSTPQTLHFQTAVGAGLIVKNVVEILNTRSHTGIDVNAAPGPTIDDLMVGGQSGLELLNEIHDRCGFEHWTESECTKDHLITTLYFDQLRGEDVSDQLHLYEGLHFADTRHKQDASQVRQTVTVVGDFGMELVERQSVTRSSQLNARDIAAKAYEAASFVPNAAETPPGLYTERLQFEVMSGSRAELSRRGDKAQTKPLRKQQTFEDDIALPALNVEQSRMLRIGNYWTRHGRFAGRYQARTVRITGIELDFRLGVCHLDSEAVL